MASVGENGVPVASHERPHSEPWPSLVCQGWDASQPSAPASLETVLEMARPPVGRGRCRVLLGRLSGKRDNTRKEIIITRVAYAGAGIKGSRDLPLLWRTMTLRLGKDCQVVYISAWSSRESLELSRITVYSKTTSRPPRVGERQPLEGRKHDPRATPEHNPSIHHWLVNVCEWKVDVYHNRHCKLIRASVFWET